MKIIIDECVPSIVKRGLPAHAIVSVQDMGWAGIKNGELLRLISYEFDVFMTSDKNLRYQQCRHRHTGARKNRRTAHDLTVDGDCWFDGRDHRMPR